MHCNLVPTLIVLAEMRKGEMRKAKSECSSFLEAEAMSCVPWFLIPQSLPRRCVRRTFLCGEGCEHRKQWIEGRLRELDSIFAVEVAAFAILDNHMHVVLKLNDVVAADWSDEDVVRRWWRR